VQEEDGGHTQAPQLENLSSKGTRFAGRGANMGNSGLTSAGGRPQPFQTNINSAQSSRGGTIDEIESQSRQGRGAKKQAMTNAKRSLQSIQSDAVNRAERSVHGVQTSKTRNSRIITNQNQAAAEGEQGPDQMRFSQEKNRLSTPNTVMARAGFKRATHGAMTQRKAKTGQDNGHDKFKQGSEEHIQAPRKSMQNV